MALRPTSRHFAYWPESVRKPNGVRCGNWSSATKLIRRNSAWSMPRSSAAAWTIRSWKNIAAGGEVRDRDVVGGEGRVHQADLELARLGIGEERPVVGVGVHPDGEDLAVPAQCHLAVQVYVPREPGGDEVAGLVLDPLHRPLQQDRGQDGADVSGVDGDLV